MLAWPFISIVSKKLNAPYRSGPSRSWIKVKNPNAPAATRAIDAPSDLGVPRQQLGVGEDQGITCWRGEGYEGFVARPSYVKVS
jgi:hypothetical protein